MAFWTVDLTTQDGAIAATRMGGAVCFLATGLSALGVVVFGLLGDAPGRSLISMAVGAGLEGLIFLIAGFRLRAGKGVGWGSAAALVLVLEMIAKLVTLTAIAGIVMNVFLLVCIVNGVRGALALRRGIADPEALAETFR